MYTNNELALLDLINDINKTCLLYTKDQMNEYEKIVFNDYGIEHPEEVA